MKDVTLNTELLRFHAPHAARLVARSRLERVFERAAPLVVAEGDTNVAGSEAVHDFRVAMRRLRSWLRACREILEDTVPRHRLRQLGDLSRKAGDVRDAEVQIAWLERARVGRNRAARQAAGWLLAKEERRQGVALRDLHDSLVKRWPDLGERLAAELRRYELDVDLDDPESTRSMGAFVATELQREVEELADALPSLKSLCDVDAVHRARIAAKRLRYLLEAFDRRLRVGAKALDVVTMLQRHLGDLHDAHIMAERIAAIRRRKRGGTGRSSIDALHAMARKRVMRLTPAAKRALASVNGRRLFANLSAFTGRWRD